MRKTPRRSHHQGSSDGFILDSWSAIAEFIRQRPQAITQISCHERFRERLSQTIQETKGKIPEVKVHNSDQQLPCVAKIKLNVKDSGAFFEEVVDYEKDFCIALDHITDPRNLGAIVRTAAFFGVRHIIVPQKRQVLLTQASVATAMGGFAYCDLVVVSSLAKALSFLKECGYSIFGSDSQGSELQALAPEQNKFVLVVGAEDKGVSESVRGLCDEMLSIGGAAQGVSSLNASVAAGILMEKLFRFARHGL